MTDLAREYGEGLYALGCEAGLQEELLAELDSINKCFCAEPKFCHLLQNMSIEKKERLSIIDHTLRGKVHPYVLNFMKLLCERGIVNEAPGCADAYRALYYKEHGIAEATVTSASPLTEDQCRRLIEQLEAKSGHRIVLKEKVDASILDGILLEMNGRKYDDTLLHRLQEIQSTIAGNQ